MCELSFDVCRDSESLVDPWLDARFENCLFVSRHNHLLLQCLRLLHPHKLLSEDYCLRSSLDTVVLLLDFSHLCLQALDVGVLLQICEDLKCLLQETSIVLHCAPNFFQSRYNSASTLFSNFWRSGRLHL